MTRYAMIFNLDTCQDQRNCMVACKAKTNSFLGSHFIETFTSTQGEYPYPNTYFFPISCQHCNSPSCVSACDRGVLSKRDDGIVAVGDVAACRDCVSKTCVQACPHQAIDCDPKTGEIGKCDLCADLVDAGRQPVCVEGCLSHSAFFGDLDDPASVVSQILEAWDPSGCVHQLPSEPGNQPSVYYLLSKKEWKGTDGLRSNAWHNG